MYEIDKWPDHLKSNYSVLIKKICRLAYLSIDVISLLLFYPQQYQHYFNENPPLTSELSL